MGASLAIATLGGAVFVSLVAELAPGRAMLIALSAMGVLAVVLWAQRRVAERVVTAIGRLEKTVEKNHKRASVWNYLLTRHLGIATDTDNDPPAGAIAPWTPHPDEIEALAVSGLVDPEFYSALVGRDFSGSFEAAAHFLTVGIHHSWSLSPFIDMKMLATETPSPLRGDHLKALLKSLRSQCDAPFIAAEIQPLVRSLSASGAARRHAGGALGAALEATRTPGRREVPSLERNLSLLRARLLQHAREVQAWKAVAQAHEVDAWDAEAEKQWFNALPSESSAVDLGTVSIIMSLGPDDRRARDAICSVLSQTHAAWHLYLVVPEGQLATDQLRRLIGGDDRISVIAASNLSHPALQNVGLGKIRSELVAFIAPGRLWAPDFLETSLRAMEGSSFGAAYAALRLPNNGADRYRVGRGGLQQLRMSNAVDLSTLVVRKGVIDQIGAFDESLTEGYEYDFALRIAEATHLVALPFVGGSVSPGEAAESDSLLARGDRIVLDRHWARWSAAPSAHPDRISVVIPTYDDSRMTLSCITSVLDDADRSGVDVEIIVVDNGSQLPYGQEILRGTASETRVKYVRLPRNLNFATGCNVGASRSSGEFILFLNNDTIVRPGTLRSLRKTIDEPGVLGVQPLLLYPDETIQTAGTVFLGKSVLPVHFLSGLPVRDAAGLASLAFSAVTAAALLMRRRDVRALRGFDPLFVNGMEDVDLCLRATTALGGGFRVSPDALVTHFESRTVGRRDQMISNRREFLKRWRAQMPELQQNHYHTCGFHVAHLGTDALDVPGPKPIITRNTESPRRRWGIRIASHGGIQSERWGDTHFASGLADALERLGQGAVVHHHATHLNASAAYDDISLVIRGKERISPLPGKINILWVISHPKDVSIEELDSFDIVMAASEKWAAKMSRLCATPVYPLLQATDTNLFNTSVEGIPQSRPLFVGGRHSGRERAVVQACLAAGIPLAVHGHGWDGLLSDEVWRSDYVSNASLCSLYRGAPVVLADHWMDMAAEGFIQNRVFDAVASGVPVISDEVAGIEDIFRGAVRVYRDVEELASLCQSPAQFFPSQGSLEEIAQYVRVEHSFDSRARALVSLVDDLSE